MNQEEQFSEESSATIGKMYEDWFLEYASYVILDRAVPAIEDGFKPVQRRIMHAMKEMDDGRFNKVANIIGQTMQYHPHGDASIGAAIVNMGQKDLLIETQGNWGDIRTGDNAAAPRYIEARLTKFALEVLFNPKTTKWQLSYDGRKKEPVTLPVKFPMLLAQGAEGIAVGLSTRILPHNIKELLESAIAHLKGKKFTLYPDFQTGGMIDVSNYKDGERGGRIRVRVPIEEVDKKTLAVRSVPFGVSTQQLTASILRANNSGKIKIRSVSDNTAKDVELLIHLAAGVSTDQTIDALYAFTDCEISLAPNACIIENEQPKFVGVSDVLKYSVEHTKELLKRELEIRLEELNNQWHYSSLERIFIENKIYRDIEEETTWEGVISAIDKGLQPFKKLLKREVVEEDIVRLTEIKIKRISKYDSFKADELIRGLENEIEEVKNHLIHLVDYAIRYYEGLLNKYGKKYPRQSEIKTFDVIQANVVAIANEKLYVNYKEGFIGTSMRRDEFVTECSDIDDIIIFRRDGIMKVVKVADKVFVGKDIIHVDVFRRGDERTTYNMMYLDGKTGITYGKRFQVPAVTRDREYDLTKGNPKSKVLYFSANPNGEAEIVQIQLSPGCNARIKKFDYAFEQLAIRGRDAQGNQVTKYPVRQVRFKESGKSTLEAPEIWYDKEVGRLNTDGYGESLGKFDMEDTIIVFYKDGSYEMTDFDLSNRYEVEDILLLEKFDSERPYTTIYYDEERKCFYVKRFLIETITLKNKYSILREESPKNYLLWASGHSDPKVALKSGKKRSPEIEEVRISEKIDVIGWRAIGNKIAENDLFEVELLNPEEDIREREEEVEELKDDANDVQKSIFDDTEEKGE
ncbi:MAG TPA: DNA gyrase/topoisomerase IV subunit A [Chitinophagaceae bacterium]|nr:DNA gyrase/topoisomerase IV subunit A [Chitinophagaceae bacterium]